MKGKKTGGRQKGTPNQLTAELKDKLGNIVSAEMDTLAERLENLDDADRIAALAKLLPYVMPRAVEVDATINQNHFSIEDRLRELCGDAFNDDDCSTPNNFDDDDE